MTDGVTRIGAVVLAFGHEPLLDDCLAALLAADVRRIAVVDNGPAQHATPDDPRIVRVEPGRNTGFAGGCNLGAHALVDDCDVLVFVNSDLVADPAAPRLLADALADPGVGLVMGLVVEAQRPWVINTAGNPIHYSMLSWAGGWGEPADSVVGVRPVPCASGALMAMRSDDWRRMDGLNESHFAYGEDVELSVRVWQSGRRVMCVAGAVGRHDYSFGGGAMKMYLLERNRLVNLLTLFESRSLAALAPGLAVVEVGVLAAAARGGWLTHKLAGYQWLWTNRRLVDARRRWVQEQRQVSDRAIGPVFNDAITPSAGTGFAVPGAVNGVLAGWRRLAWPAGRDAGLDGLGAVAGMAGWSGAIEGSSGGSVALPRAENRAPSSSPGTRGEDYTDRLVTLEGARWKQILDVQRPYRRRLQRMDLGRTLDIGCGIGRNLGISPGMVGVDHNAASVEVARSRGFSAWTTNEWPSCRDAVPGSFDSLLIAHVLEHLDAEAGELLLREYLPFLRAGGRVVMICPQERGYASDATHVRYLDPAALGELAQRVGLEVESTSSFPFPRAAGRVFTHNEHVVVARRASVGGTLARANTWRQIGRHGDAFIPEVEVAERGPQKISS